MRVQIKKGRDSPPTLACVRADGSRTWSRVHPFFPLHDLTHYAVETVLGLRDAFFGLVACGWDLDAFADRATRARMPAEALWAEQIVGLLDLERAGHEPLAPDAFNGALGDSLARHGLPPVRPLSAAELAAVRALRSELHARWTGLAPGATLELPFPSGATS